METNENIISMETNEKNANSKEINEARKPKRTFDQACKEGNAIPLKQFEKEFWDAFKAGYRKHGKH